MKPGFRKLVRTLRERTEVWVPPHTFMVELHKIAIANMGKTTYRGMAIRAVKRGYVADHFGRGRTKVHPTLEGAMGAVDAVHPLVWEVTP